MNDGSIAIEGQPLADAALSIGADDVPDLSPLAQDALRRLLRVWIQFERDLVTVPILRRLELGTYTLADHRRLLLNMRQQVIEGSRWIARAASSMDRDHSGLRSLVLPPESVWQRCWSLKPLSPTEAKRLDDRWQASAP